MASASAQAPSCTSSLCCPLYPLVLSPHPRHTCVPFQCVNCTSCETFSEGFLEFAAHMHHEAKSTFTTTTGLRGQGQCLPLDQLGPRPEHS